MVQLLKGITPTMKEVDDRNFESHKCAPGRMTFLFSVKKLTSETARGLVTETLFYNVRPMI